MAEPRSILIVDDDPTHLKLYTWIVERAGFRAAAALVKADCSEIPAGQKVDAAVMDYRYGGAITGLNVALRIKELYPAAPIIVLSDSMWMPDDVAPYATAFVRKGEPETLLETISKITGRAAGPRPNAG